MAKCKACNTDIPDGGEYCTNCLENNNSKSEESYLDSLLKTVINSQGIGLDEKKSIESNSPSKNLSNQLNDSALNQNDLGNHIDDYDYTGFSNNIDFSEKRNYDKHDEDISEDDVFTFFQNYENDNINDEPVEDSNNKTEEYISTETLNKTETLNENEYLSGENVLNDNVIDSSAVNRNELDDNTSNINDDAYNNLDKNVDDITNNNLNNFAYNNTDDLNYVTDINLDNATDENPDNAIDISPDSFTDENLDNATEINLEGFTDENPDNATDINPDNFIDENLDNTTDKNPDSFTDEYLDNDTDKILDMALENKIDNPNSTLDNDLDHSFEDSKQDINMQDYNTMDFNSMEDSSLGDTDEDLLKLLDMISSQNEEEIKDQSENQDIPENSKDENSNSNLDESGEELNYGLEENNDLQELSALFNNSEEDFNVQTDDLNDLDNDFSNVTDREGASLFDNNQNELNDILELDSISNEGNNSKEKKSKNKEEKKEKTKKSFLQFLFGDDDPEDESEDSDQSKEASKKAKEKKKNKKGSKSNIEGGTEDNKGKKNKAAKKVKVKKEKKPKPVKEKIVDPEELRENSKKLNKPAVIIIFATFALIALFVIIGTNTYSYSLNITSANVDFGRKRYTEAYYDISGLKVKKKDTKLYDKIMTVMYVNKELNSYYNYSKIGKEPEALDSLLKGLERYDEYVAKAKKLGVKNDLNNIKEQILNELDSKFNISEDEAAKINSIKEQDKYSILVYRVASKIKNE